MSFSSRSTNSHHLHLSRVLFREEPADDDLRSSDPISEGRATRKALEEEGDDERPMIYSSSDGSDTDHDLLYQTPISSHHQGDGDREGDQLGTPTKARDEAQEHSSPFNINIKPTASSPIILRQVRELKLYGSPLTPKTLMKRAETNTVSPQSGVKIKRSRVSFGTETPFIRPGLPDRGQKRRSLLTPRSANVNPFTPTGMLLQQSKLKRRKLNVSHGSVFSNHSTGETVTLTAFDEPEEESDPEEERRLNVPEEPLSDMRYHKDFVELSQIGTGEFGSVFKCVNRLDGCVYALKRTRKPIHGSLNEKRALNEVYAHAVLGKHSRVVRYYSAWAENERMYIQNEFCEEGSLANLIADLEAKQEKLAETQVKKILLHIAQGLKYIHSQNLVHMDIKPGNIFISRNSESSVNTSMNKTTESSDDGFEEDNDNDSEDICDVTYKIGDLGLVTSVANAQVEEGDCRYLPLEILHDDYSHLPQADIFALGLTIYELTGAGPLPKNGDDWQRLRSGQIPRLPGYSDELTKLIRKMIHPDPEKRPSANALVHHTVLVPFADKSKAQLRRELNVARFRNEMLTRQLEEAAKCLQRFSPSVTSTPPAKGSRKIFTRSRSVSTF